MRLVKIHKGLIKIGILGAGIVTELYHLPVLRNMPNIEISWLCDKLEDRAQGLAKTHSIPRVYGDIKECTEVDMVLVAIPVGNRREPLEYIFRRGWHAFCEKPFATTCEEHDWVLQQARLSGVEVGVGFMRRFYPGNTMAQDILSHSPFGPIVEIWASEGTRIRGTGREDEWYQGSKEAGGGGVLMESGSHLIDQVFTMCAVDNFMVDSCSLEYRRGLDYEAKVMGTIKLNSGQKCRFGIALSRINDLYNGIMIQFNDAQLRLGVVPDGTLYLCDKKGEALARLDNPERSSIGSGVYGAFYSEWQEFFGQCTSKRPSRVNADSALLTTRFIETCYQWKPLGPKACVSTKTNMDKK